MTKKKLDGIYSFLPIFLSCFGLLVVIVSLFFPYHIETIAPMIETSNEFEMLILDSSTSEVVNGAKITIKFVNSSEKLESFSNERGFVNFEIPESIKDQKVKLTVEKDSSNKIEREFESINRIASIIQLD